MVKTHMTRSMPQGMPIGSLLWNVAVDTILEAELPDQCFILCSASYRYAGQHGWGGIRRRISGG